jgi:multidrug efflux pump subunit AcrA (membrane-fusion protein)
MNETLPDNSLSASITVTAAHREFLRSGAASNGKNAESPPTIGKRRRFFSWWWLFYLLFICAVGAYVWFNLAPSFWSPRSRVYSSLLGYPSVMRYLGKPIELTAIDRVATRHMVNIISAEGSLGYLNEVPIHSELPGIVTQVLVEPGQEVRKGDLLMRIDGGRHIRRIDELSLELTKWQVAIAKSALERAKKMLESRSISRADYEQFVLNMKQADAALALAKEKYAYSFVSRSKAVAVGLPKFGGSLPNEVIDIVATISGTVFRRSAQLGQNLTTSDAPLVVIGDRLTFLAMFDQRYASDLHEGDKGKFYLKAYPGRAFEGEVLRIAHYVEPENQKKGPQMSAWVQKQPPDTFDVWISIPTELLKNKKLLTGMNGYVMFERPFSARAIPESSLMRYSGRTGTVLTVDNTNHIQVKKVSYATVADGWVAIDTGLEDGERVVLEGQLGLKPGDTVVIPEGSEATSPQAR